MHNAIPEFQAAMRARGLEPPPEIIPGKLHRFSANGKRGDDAGWCRLFDDGTGGVFGNWREGYSESWHARRNRPYSPCEREAFMRQCDEARREREAEDARGHAEVAFKAAELWKAAKPAPEDHPYLMRKGIKPNGARIHNRRLVLALRDTGGELHSLQFIDADGDKKYLFGGRKAACYFSIGRPSGALCIAEGFATAASIHEATGQAVAVAFDAENLLPVATALRAKYPELRLILCADDDAATAGNPGITKATAAAREVDGLLAMPDFGEQRPDKASDFNDLAKARGPDAVRACIEAARPVEASQAANVGESAPNTMRVVVEAEKRAWPAPLDEAALIGLAGDIVRTIRPRTEADDAAILMQTLVAFGALVGRTHHVRIEGDRHYAQLFGLVVGDTSNARKGTSWGRVREIFSGVPGWPPVVDGLSSGEGLKYAVRDPVTKSAKDGSGDQVVDEGVKDKRLLVVESEFAQVLRQVARAGNTLSPTIRAAWDTGTLRTLTRNDPITATGAHVCIVGHITAEELRAELTATDSANGFANRFLFMCAKKSKMLSRGGGAVPPSELDDLQKRIADAAARAGLVREVEWTDAAWGVWDRVYPRLSTGSGGLFGAVTARGAPQCVRLALTYALMDESDRIDAPHVLAALAVWERVEESARWIFGSALGDRVADEILRELRLAGDAGIGRTQISRLFKGHESADRINAALNVLAEKELARRVDTESTGGRPAEIWRAV